MKHLAELLASKVAPKKTSERAELIKFWVDNVLNKKGKKYPPARIAMLLSHLTINDLYYFKSVCNDVMNRSGQVSFQKFFWWSIKAKK